MAFIKIRNSPVVSMQHFTFESDDFLDYYADFIIFSKICSTSSNI